VHRGHRARLYPDPDQARAFGRWAGCARLLWNLALDLRRWGRGHPIGRTSQGRELTDLRAEYDWLAELPAQAAQGVFAELDLAFQRFRLCLTAYPQRKKKGRSAAVLRLPQDIVTRRLNKHWGEVKLPKVGWVRFRWSRSLDGTLKHVTLTQKYGEWHAAFCLEQLEKPSSPNPLPATGVDRGVEFAFMTSSGETFDQAMWKATEKRRLVTLERRKAHQQKGSQRFRQTCLSIGRLHQRASNRRRDFAHKTSTTLAKNHGLVAIEALLVPNMTRSARGTVDAPGRNVRQKAGLNRAILDKGRGLVVEQLRWKCPQYGSVLIEVPPRNTSLQCAACGHVSPHNRPLRAVFVCVRCGHADHADTNAAINIRERGMEKLAQTGGQPGIGRKAPKRLRTWRQPLLKVVG
jgi:putative transposase